MSPSLILPESDPIGTMGKVDNESDQEATQLILETLFDIKVRVTDIHNVLFLDAGDKEERTEEDA